MTSLQTVDLALLRKWPLPQVQATQNKEDRGRVLVIAGSVTVPGAAVLSATAALRAGAGKLQIATCTAASVQMGLLVPEARVFALPEIPSWGAPHDELLNAMSQADALLIGPGMESHEDVHRLERSLVRTQHQISVLDAGALGPGIHAGVLCTPTILTPHFGEMAGMLEIPRAQIEADPVRYASHLARLTGAVVVLKSPVTYVIAPGGQGWVHTGGVPGLGISGSGDVLAGLITGLAARGASAEQAAVWAVAIHGLAGETLTQRIGPLGFLARELAGEFPGLMRQASSDVGFA
ncbi:NAD(P)H-hydrate dehydratase [Lysobacter capsici]|uniref:NAD(P)H-hydrate dehydratase n=1 Tax=Lysobacter capsici TaxID=435897 RepID=UPI00287B829E|nr:NAD(P)H-hydrate dehydratase [Lysobacter capsici]WND80465.1 NAD(P)H-hydrate dehydratase [Lysobacter capsici]WND85662.1 NAD(P)H-hydrate dehydratase [Lysobacter capsici]